MASAANLVSLNSDSEPEDDGTYFEETFSSEHLGLGADPFPVPGELHLHMRQTRKTIAMAGEYTFARCRTGHCGGCRAFTCGELQMQGNLGQNDGCPQCQVDRTDLCHRRGPCIHFNQQQVTLFASTQQLVSTSATDSESNQHQGQQARAPAALRRLHPFNMPGNKELVLPTVSSPAPSLRPASPLPPGTIHTIPRGQEHLFSDNPEADAQRHQQMLDDSVLARTMTSLEQTHISGQAQPVPEEVQVQVALEEQLVDGAVGGAVDQSAGVAVEQASQVQVDPHSLGTDPVTPQSVRPKLLLTAEQQQARLRARAKTLGAAAISPGDPGLIKVETSLYAPDLSSIMPSLGDPSTSYATLVWPNATQPLIQTQGVSHPVMSQVAQSTLPPPPASLVDYTGTTLGATPAWLGGQVVEQEYQPVSAERKQYWPTAVQAQQPQQAWDGRGPDPVQLPGLSSSSDKLA